MYKRQVWHREVIDTKTEHRAATVHLLPNVVTELRKHREANPGTKWVFEGPRVFPLDLATLGSKRIKEALKGTDADAITAKANVLQQASMKLGEAVYKQAAEQPAADAGAAEPKQDDVVDAEFTEVDDDKKNKKSA